jgi:hypothetical protein
MTKSLRARPAGCCFDTKASVRQPAPLALAPREMGLARSGTALAHTSKPPSKTSRGTEQRAISQRVAATWHRYRGPKLHENPRVTCATDILYS